MRSYLLKILLGSLTIWYRTLNRILDETLIVIKYITSGSFPFGLIDDVLQHLKVILR